MVTHLDLFSGIGGFALAASWVWGSAHRLAAFCEIDPDPQENLRKNWIGVPIHNDIHSLDGRHYAGIDLLTAGIPCQPYSVAGHRRGDADDRALWPETRRVIREARPRWVLIENVAGFTTLALDGVLSDLEAEDYSAGALVLPALALNAPHRRDRVWIMAYDESRGWSAARTAIPGEGYQPAWPYRGRRGALGDTDTKRQLQPSGIVPDERGRHRDAGPALVYADGERWKELVAPDIAIEKGDLYSGRHYWDHSVRVAGRRIPAPVPESEILRVADGVSHRVGRIILPMTHRRERGDGKGISMLGNAIVPQVAAEIFQGIKRVEEGL